MSEHYEVAVYCYPGGNQIRIAYHPDGYMTYRDASQRFPYDPITQDHTMHPAEEGKNSETLSYEEIGLYYGYSMPHWPHVE